MRKFGPNFRNCCTKNSPPISHPQPGRNGCNLIKTVPWTGFVPFLKTAASAPVQYRQSTASAAQSNRLHHPAAGRPSVAGIHVNMPAPQTPRAVVGVTITRHKIAAVSAGKVLYFPLKCFVFYHSTSFAVFPRKRCLTTIKRTDRAGRAPFSVKSTSFRFGFAL